MPSRLFFSSGDLLADRRYDFARDLQLRGDLQAAADLLLQAVELAPGFASAWFSLGEIREQLNLHDLAIVAYRQACIADAADRHGAILRLVRLGAAPVSAMPLDYVRTLFDQYAPRFDKALVENLNYRGPELLRDAVATASRVLRRPPFFRRALDLGCGTGLSGRAFASIVDEMTGIDLSDGMLDKARATGLYAALKADDMLTALQAEADAAADLILAADALVYVPDLAPICAQAARVLAPRGLLAFSVETHPGDGVILGAALRFAHGANTVRGALRAAGLSVMELAATSTRTDGGVPVPGLIVVAART